MKLQFGDCTLDLDTRELVRGGEVIHVEPMAYRLLEILIAARPKALSKEELQDKLWPATFVSDHNLARLVDVLRSCLGDEAKNSRYIRTAQRFGYAFCAKAAVVSRTVDSASSDFCCWIVWGDREIALLEGENVLGRDPSTAVRIESNSVSRRHARILVAGASATLEDMGSRNGTFLDGRRVERATNLQDGGRIKIGAAELVFRCFRGLGSTASEVSDEIR